MMRPESARPWRRVGTGRRMVRVADLRMAGMAACLLVACLLVAWPGNAAAQADMRALLDRLERLERQLTTLEQGVYRGRIPAVQSSSQESSSQPSSSQTSRPAPLAPAAATDVQIRLTDLENEMRSLTGRIEETGHRVQQIGARLDKLVADLDLRLQQLESRPGAAAPGQAAPAGGAPPAAAQPAQSPQELYDHALALLMRADEDAGYAEAERSLTAFINTYPKDKNQSDARFFLGETLYVRRDYAQAAVAYAEGYRAYPNGSKAPDSLLKLGMALGQLGKTSETCQAFAELSTKFKNPPPSVAQSLARERQRYKCR